MLNNQFAQILLVVLAFFFSSYDRIKFVNLRYVQRIAWLIFCIIFSLKLDTSKYIFSSFVLVLLSMRIFFDSKSSSFFLRSFIISISLYLVEMTDSPFVILFTALIVDLYDNWNSKKQIVEKKSKLAASLVVLIALLTINIAQGVVFLDKFDLWLSMAPLGGMLALIFITYFELISSEENLSPNGFDDARFFKYVTVLFCYLRLLNISLDSIPEVLQKASESMLLGSLVVLLFLNIRRMNIFRLNPNWRWAQSSLKNGIIGILFSTMLATSKSELVYYWLIFLLPGVISIFITFDDGFVETNQLRIKLNVALVLLLGFSPLSPVFWVLSKFLKMEWEASGISLLYFSLITYSLIELAFYVTTLFRISQFRSSLKGLFFDFLTRAVIIGLISSAYYSRLIAE